MRPFTSTISLEEARRRLDAAVRPIARTERIPISQAAGRVVAADVTSAIDVPAFARAAMDGYAVVSADTTKATPETPARLRLVDRIYTGQMSTVIVVPGTCAEIATGAPVPAGADAVVMVEETASEGELILIRTDATPGRNIGRRGADIMTGDLVVRAGGVLTPSRVGALAAIGQSDVTVTQSRGSPSYRQATKSSTPVSGSKTGRSTMSTDSPSAPSSTHTGAHRDRTGRRRTRSSR